jgi:hypothetical protein
MKKFNTFKIWFGKKLINLGFDILLKMDDRDWNPIKECYPGSVKQLRYTLGAWLVKHGIKLETKALDNTGGLGFTTFHYFDENFYLGNKNKNKKRKRNNDGPDFNQFFKNWDGE